MLGATQHVRVFRAVAKGHSAIGKRDPTLAGLILRSLPLGEHIEKTRLTLNHNVTHICGCARNESDTPSYTLGDKMAHTLCPNASLTKASACHPEGSCVAIT